MKNYSRKKSTPGKVAYRTPSRVKSSGIISIRAQKAGCCKIKGKTAKCSC